MIKSRSITTGINCIFTNLTKWNVCIFENVGVFRIRCGCLVVVVNWRWTRFFICFQYFAATFKAESVVFSESSVFTLWIWTLHFWRLRTMFKVLINRKAAALLSIFSGLYISVRVLRKAEVIPGNESPGNSVVKKEWIRVGWEGRASVSVIWRK